MSELNITNYEVGDYLVTQSDVYVIAITRMDYSFDEPKTMYNLISISGGIRLSEESDEISVLIEDISDEYGFFQHVKADSALIQFSIDNNKK